MIPGHLEGTMAITRKPRASGDDPDIVRPVCDAVR